MTEGKEYSTHRKWEGTRPIKFGSEDSICKATWLEAPMWAELTGETIIIRV